jgi:hypothetical protein
MAKYHAIASNVMGDILLDVEDGECFILVIYSPFISSCLFLLMFLVKHIYSAGVKLNGC